MPAGYNSLPQRIANRYTDFLTGRMGMGLYPRQLKSDPWRVEYVQEHPGYIWRPLIPIGRFEGAGEHPLAKHFSNSDSAFAKTYRRIYKRFTDSREDFILKLNQEMGLNGDDVNRDYLHSQLTPSMGDIHAAALILECGLVLNEERDEEERRLVGDVQHAMLKKIGLSSLTIKRHELDYLFGAYNFIESGERDTLIDAIVGFQKIALSLRYPEMRHQAAFYIRDMAETYPPSDALARRVVEDHLRAVWAKIISEPQLPSHWAMASKYLTAAISLALVNAELFDPDTLRRIDEFQEQIYRVAQSGEGLQREPQRRTFAFIIPK